MKQKVTLNFARNPKLKCPTGVSKWNSGAYVSNVAYDYQCTEDKMKALLLEHGAVFTGVQASEFGNYASGVFQGCT